VASLVSLALEHARVRRSSRTALQQTVTVLAALIESRDSYTESHCVHLAESGLAIGVRMGLPARRLDRVTFGGLLHDIGKVAVSDAVLNKPGPLDSDEYLEMQTHASIGEGILARIGFLENVAPIVRQHHERLDGQGYPGGLKGEEILLEARILAVVDTFDAMTTTRPYRAALPWSRAVEEIRAGAGTQFDPEVVGVFLQYLEGEVSQWTKSSPT
jgi:putative nucleotidyltransferase with HDIG domain